jgi:hypothetical protein
VRDCEYRRDWNTQAGYLIYQTEAKRAMRSLAMVIRRDAMQRFALLPDGAPL